MDCSIYLDNDGPPLPIQGGCGCRGEAACAHVGCRIKAAKRQGPGVHTALHICMSASSSIQAQWNLA